MGELSGVIKMFYHFYGCLSYRGMHLNGMLKTHTL